MKKTALFTKLGLAVCFLLGLLFVFFGVRGGDTATDAGLGSGDSSKAISDLSDDLSSVWNILSKDRDALADDGRTAADAALLPLVKDSWESRKEGGGAEAEAFINEGGADSASRLYRLMYLSGLMNGPKVTAAVKKAIAAVPKDNRPAFRQQAQFRAAFVVNENAVIPDFLIPCHGKHLRQFRSVLF